MSLIKRSTTLRSLDSSVPSSSDTTSSGYPARGIGSISGRAIYAIGELAIHGVENLAILKRIYSIDESLRDASAMDLKEVERLYKDLFEFSRPHLYPVVIRNLALKLILRRICLRDVEYLVRCINKQHSKHRKNLLEELITMLDPVRLRSTRESKANNVANAYKKSLSGSEAHSLLPFIVFCDKLACSTKESTVRTLLEAGVLDFLSHAYSSRFYDPFAKSDPRASRRTFAFKTACIALVKTIRELCIDPAPNHPVFNQFSLLTGSQMDHVNDHDKATVDLHHGSRGMSMQNQSFTDTSPLSLTFSEPGPSESPTIDCSRNPLAPMESPIIESPLEMELPERPLPPLPFNNKVLSPTHLKVTEFGSRFLPHSMSPIRCLLPLKSDRLLLIGHDNGLSVIDTFPHQRSNDGSLVINGPEEAQARMIWSGQSVLQLSLLEGGEDEGEGAVQGAVLALLGDSASNLLGTKVAGYDRSIRIYKLSSLLSLAQWAVNGKGKSHLDLGRLQEKGARQSYSMNRGLSRSFMSLINHSEERSTSYDILLSPLSMSSQLPFTPESQPPLDIDERNLEWDMVDETSQLRWANDFVQLASNSSNQQVISYALWSNDRPLGGCYLAIATKNSILLYHESPATNRIFQLIKEIGLPYHPKSLTFCQQATRQTYRKTRTNHRGNLTCDEHLSLFVVFDRKACCIRVADSTMSKMELYDGGGDRQSTTSDSSTSTLRSRLSLDAPHHPKWIPPVQCTIPVSRPPGGRDKITILTRGKDTHIVPCPIPIGFSSHSPIFATSWQTPPSSVSVRLSATNSDFLQLVAMGEFGIEVHEIPMPLLEKSSKKSSPTHAPLHITDDLGGYGTGYLCDGGHWDERHHRYHRQHLSSLWRSPSAASTDAHAEIDSVMMKEEHGIYGWYRKGGEDWRIFWVGGPLTQVNGEG